MCNGSGDWEETQKKSDEKKNWRELKLETKKESHFCKCKNTKKNK